MHCRSIPPRTVYAPKPRALRNAAQTYVRIRTRCDPHGVGEDSTLTVFVTVSLHGYWPGPYAYTFLKRKQGTLLADAIFLQSTSATPIQPYAAAAANASNRASAISGPPPIGNHFLSLRDRERIHSRPLKCLHCSSRSSHLTSAASTCCPAG